MFVAKEVMKNIGINESVKSSFRSDQGRFGENIIEKAVRKTKSKSKYPKLLRENKFNFFFTPTISQVKKVIGTITLMMARSIPVAGFKAN